MIKYIRKSQEGNKKVIEFFKEINFVEIFFSCLIFVITHWWVAVLFIVLAWFLACLWLITIY